MITVKDVHDFYQTYCKNKALLHDTENRLFRCDLELSDWIKLLEERTVITRNVFTENENGLNKYVRPFIEEPELFTPQIIDAFLEEIAPLVQNDCPDYELTENVLLAMVEYMTSHSCAHPSLESARSCLALCKMSEHPPIIGTGINDLDMILSYIDDNLGVDALMHIQNITLMLTVKQQLHTFIHSVMVSQLATLVARSIIQQKPDFFKNIGRTPANMLGFINTAALLHDTGKSDIAHIINLQSRKLSNEEFSVIKMHPVMGGSFLEGIPALRQFADIARGHHRFYDGMGGYPESFDNTASPYRNVIDLISICDSIDAATDFIGRCYSPGKSLKTVLDELQDGSGTRYSPDIVSIITGDPVLTELIENMVTVGRESTCYRIYKEYTRNYTRKRIA